MPDIEEQLKDRMEALAAAQVFKKSAEPCLSSVLTFLNDWLVNQLID